MTQDAGAGGRRDGAVRGEVRRPGPGDLGRRLVARAVRRHARPALRPARAGDAARRGVDRLRRPPGRGAGRRGRLRVPARSTCWSASSPTSLKVRPEELPERVSGLVAQLRDAEKEIDRFRAGQVLAVAGSLAERPRDVFGVGVVTHDAGEVGGGRPAHPGARRPGPAAGGPAGRGRRRRGGARGARWSWSRPTRRPRRWGVACRRPGPGGGRGARRRRRRQGRRRAGRRHRPGAAGRGAAPGRARRRRAGHRGCASRRGPATVRAGVRLGVDVGSVRVGVARCDRAGLLGDAGGDGAGDDPTGADLSTDRDTSRRNVTPSRSSSGCRSALSGGEGTASAAAREYAVAVARRVHPVPVRLVDERLSTVTAHRALREAGVAGRRHRPVVDQAAAVVILQSALDAERASGQPPGSIVDPGTAAGGPGAGRRDWRRLARGERDVAARRRATPAAQRPHRRQRRAVREAPAHAAVAGPGVDPADQPDRRRRGRRGRLAGPQAA